MLICVFHRIIKSDYGRSKGTVIRPEKITINPLYSSTQVNNYLKGMMQKIHKKQITEAISMDSVFRQKQLKDLLPIKQISKQNTSNVLNLEHKQKVDRIRAPNVSRKNYIGKYNLKVAMKVHTIAELQQLEKLKTNKENWNKSCQAIFKSQNYQKMNCILKQTQNIRPSSAYCNKLNYQSSQLLQKPKSAYRTRSRQQRGTSVKVIPKYGFKFKLPL